MAKTFAKDSASEFQNFHVDFHKCNSPSSTRLSQLGWISQVLSNMGCENCHRCSQTRKKMLRLWHFKGYHKDCDKFLNHILQVTDDETWVSFVNVEIKDLWKRWMHIHKPKRFQQTSAYQKADNNCFMTENEYRCWNSCKKSHNNVTRVLRSTKIVHRTF
jgi:hypothetical protein